MILRFLHRLRRDKKGQGLVEYGLLIAGVAMISAAAVSVFGHKTTDMISAVAAILPGAHTGDNAALTSGHLIETTAGAAGTPISLDAATIATNSGTDRLGTNVGGAALTAGDGTGGGFGGLVLEPN